ncbi:MAG: hypothetical protein H0V52_06495 [Acidimicrobiia bacterium]|nr:hypothetical protein [Acidimicrobiia bacterium]MDQ3538117.1 hypothetical protein [Actinomycetota bacterium]
METGLARSERAGGGVAAAVVIAGLSGVLSAGAVLLALAHAGLSLPLLSALGPGGDRAVPPAAIAFSVLAVLAAVVAAGAFARRPWAWPLGLVVHALTVLGAATPFRGPVSLVGILLGLTAVAILLSRPGRSALLPSR